MVTGAPARAPSSLLFTDKTFIIANAYGHCVRGGDRMQAKNYETAFNANREWCARDAFGQLLSAA